MLNSPAPSQRLSFLKQLLTILFLIIALIVLASVIWQPLEHLLLPLLISLYCAIALIFSPLFIRVISIVLFSLSIGSLTQVPEPYLLWSQGIIRSSGMFVLFSAVPLLSEAFLYLVSGLPDEEKRRPPLPAAPSRGILAILSVALTQMLLSIVASIGAVWINVPILQRDNFPTETIHRGVSLGYSINVSTSPFDVIVHTCLLLAGVSYLQYLTGALVLSGLYITAFILVELLLQIKGRNIAAIPVHTAFLRSKRQRRFFLLNIVLLVSLAATATTVCKGISSAVVAGVIAGIYSLLWILWKKGFSALAELSGLVQRSIPNFSGFLPLLIAAALFGNITGKIPQMMKMEVVLQQLLTFPAYVSVLLLALFPVVLSLFGIHMLVGIVLIGTIVSPDALSIRPAGFALLLMVSYVSAMNISPFSPFNAILSTATDCRSPIRVIQSTLFSWLAIIGIATWCILLWYST